MCRSMYTLGLQDAPYRLFNLAERLLELVVRIDQADWCVTGWH